MLVLVANEPNFLHWRLQTALETRDAARSTVAALHEQEVQMHKLQDQYAEVSTVTSGTSAMHCSIPVTKKPRPTACIDNCHANPQPSGQVILSTSVLPREWTIMFARPIEAT